MQQVEVPVEAILGEVLQPRLLRRWLVAQGDRVFPEVGLSGIRHALGTYLWEETGRRIRLDRATCPQWVRDFADWSYACVGANTYTAREAVAALDAIMAREGDERV